MSSPQADSSRPTTPLMAEDGHEDTLSSSDRNHSDNHSDTLSDVDDSSSPEPLYNLTLTLHSRPISLPIYDSTATIQDLSDTVASHLHIPASHQKFLITPKTGLLKPPFKDPTLLLSTLIDKKIVLLGATTTEVETLTSDITLLKSRTAARQSALQAGRRVRANSRKDWKKIQDNARYTFHTLRPLPYLPNPDKSLRYLERLRDDAGIKATMRKHGFSVGLLTEMDPAEHTTHESRTLGLNRNRGEVIELRLRTDAYDGYRDYKVIRKTLCHELTHNVWGDHDARFWKLCREIEAEVEKNDWRRGGNSVGGEEFYNPEDDGEVDHECDGGGWEGGEFTLGGEGGAGEVGELSRREIMARAAEERMRRQREAKEKEQRAKQEDAAMK